MRTASLVGAAEYVKARLDAAATARPTAAGRRLRAAAGRTSRASCSATGPRRTAATCPSPSSAASPTPYAASTASKSLLKYDTGSKGYRFGDVLNLVHAAPADPDKPWQGELFQYALDRRHNPDTPSRPQPAACCRAPRGLMAVPAAERRAVVTAGAAPRSGSRAAGMTWEALAGWLQGPMDAAAWEAVIPSMGYMALLRNLRNFDEAGVSDEVAARRRGAARPIPAEVARSRQFPFRFLAAYQHAPLAALGVRRWSRRSGTRWPTCRRCPAGR